MPAALITDERIIELRAATVPHLDLSEIKASGGDEDRRKALDAYLETNRERFADPGENDTCLNCDRRQNGIFGAFGWGIIHGEGACVCGWPGRAFHYFDLPDGTRGMVRAVLQYHPNQVLTKGEK